ncbi:hypothetical protein C9974_07605 [Marinobacter sp. B9-2]|nr:hypothetical protein C9974_07605 [Marinobacter sp. B9-2]
MNYDISLVIATFNGGKTLPRTIESINNLIIPTGLKVNIVIINNNSNDDTQKILDNAQFPCPKLVLFETKQGKNAALNKIFNNEVSLGDLIIFSDDDVIFPQNFLTRYSAISKEFSDISIFGGGVAPFWLKEPPRSLLVGIDTVVAYAITPKEQGYCQGLIDPVKIHGPNMAIRRDIFLGSIRFNEDIGPNGANYMMGSETEILYRLRELGHRAYFDEYNEVFHIISPEQASKKWIEERAYKAGRSFLMHQIKGGNKFIVPELNGFPRWALKKIWKMYCLRVVFFYNPALRYKFSWKISHLKGYCDEYKMFRK